MCSCQPPWLKNQFKESLLQRNTFPSFSHYVELCPVKTLKCYEMLTAPLRPATSTNLFITLVNPHKPVTSATIAQWLYEVLKLAGIDVSIFSGHSVGGTSLSAAAGTGVTTNDILKAANWSSDSVFRRFYNHAVHDSTFGQSRLSSGNSDFWCASVKLSLLKYNFQMPQIIQDYMLFAITWRGSSWVNQWSYPLVFHLFAFKRLRCKCMFGDLKDGWCMYSPVSSVHQKNFYNQKAIRS